MAQLNQVFTNHFIVLAHPLRINPDPMRELESRMAPGQFLSGYGVSPSRFCLLGVKRRH